MSRDLPILFSAPMVRAVRADLKTQTRRIVKAPGLSLDPRSHDYAVEAHMLTEEGRFGVAFRGDRGLSRLVPCPYGAPGDRLWVRETHCPRYFDNGRAAYRADWNSIAAETVPEPKWNPSIFMRRHDSRITLEVTGVRVERLRAITEEDAKAEGVTPAPFCKAGRPTGMEHVEAFEDLWSAINGAESWAANPWVWVVSFKRVEQAREAA